MAPHLCKPFAEVLHVTGDANPPVAHRIVARRGLRLSPERLLEEASAPPASLDLFFLGLEGSKRHLGLFEGRGELGSLASKRRTAILEMCHGVEVVLDHA